MKQQSLGLTIGEAPSLENFYFAQSNQSLYSYLLSWLNDGQLDSLRPSPRQGVLHIAPVLYLFSPAGLGVSHLLSACAQWAQEKGRSSLYFSALDNTQSRCWLSPEPYDLVCIDDVDCLNVERSTAIFHAYNFWQMNPTKVMFGAHTLPQSIDTILPDLRTRLTQALSLCLYPLLDEDLHLGLLQYLQRVSWQSPELVAQGLLTYYSRDAAKIFRFIRDIDCYLPSKGELSYSNFKRAIALALAQNVDDDT